MTFKDQMAKDLAIFFNTNEFAETVIYDDGTTQKDIIAVVDLGNAGQKHPADHGIITVMASDVPDPRYRQKFIFGGKEFFIDKDSGKDDIVSQDGGLTWDIKISANERFSPW